MSWSLLIVPPALVTGRRAGLMAAACFAAQVLAPAHLLAAPADPAPLDPATTLAAPPVPTTRAAARRGSRPKPGTAELAAGGVLLGLGFAAELGGAVVSTRCILGSPCAAGLSLTVGSTDGAANYTLISTGTSSAYVMGRLVAAPLLVGGFTLTMVGLAQRGPAASSWSHARKRSVAWSLFGTGLGVLVTSRILRAVFAVEGVCQDPLCVYGFDQSSLWVGRGLTFAGSGMLVRGAARRMELGVGGGPSNGYGLSITGRF
jgi:hypothetical protein